MDELSNKGLVTLDDRLQQGIGVDSNCLSMVYNPTNDDSAAQIKKSTITLSSGTCNSKKAVACTFDKVEALSSKPIQFPCIPGSGSARKKRASQDNEENESNEASSNFGTI